VRLVLFDIDGTLLWTDGAGRRAIHRALREVFGATGPTDYWFDGKTDPQIVRELMGFAGRDAAHVERELEALLERYVELLHEELSAPGHVVRPLPGVPELLDRLEARDDVILGLLTGNVEAGAKAKLRAVGIDPERFRIGAFGSDHADRPQLPAVARDRMRSRMGHDIAGDRIVVIGDTPADLTCGRSLGANAIGVATGRFSVTELSQFEAVAVFQDLTDTEAVLRAILDT
jgi:phosphoglycolate phosphatase